ncbi:hypothetical protein AAFF_G00364430 [Aldrovandia affinis]|uniref:Reverse transcriptase domain-containing protein n=1 Tax=Aldrovandia affinis TaxID=143900 RepID=A0AAD7SJS2_9TELE|nr:hypothetical protein AAFF_G00364430 [Aldrovandia affinis]
MEFVFMPECIRNLVSSYFKDLDLHMCFSLQDFTIGWQQLEVEITMGCSISPILFVAAFEIILIGARQMVGGVKLQLGQRLPPLRSYMDDVTSILQTAACTTRLLKRLDELVSWARMKIKPFKTQSLSRRKWVRIDNTIFVAGGEQIQLLVIQLIQSLGSSLTSRLGKLYRNNSQMVWQELTKANSPESKGSLWEEHLAAASFSLGYKQGKTRLVQELRESTDQFVRCADAQVGTGRKWKAQVEVDQAISRLQHLEVVSRVQAGRTGLGWGEAPQFWSKANRKERKEMVVSEVTKMEEERYKIKAVSQGRQGGWTT